MNRFILIVSSPVAKVKTDESILGVSKMYKVAL